MEENIKAVIFDFDDTPVDPSTFFARHIQQKIEHLFPPNKQKDLIEKALQLRDSNIGFEDIFLKAFEEKGPLVLEKYREDAMDTPYTPRDGMAQLVEMLLEKGTKLYILSNRTNKLAQRLEQAGFTKEDFEIYEAVEKKPNQLAYSEVFEDLKKQGIEKEEVVIYGNHISDYLALPDKWRDRFIATPRTLESFEEFEALSKELSREISIPKEYTKLS